MKNILTRTLLIILIITSYSTLGWAQNLNFPSISNNKSDNSVSEVKWDVSTNKNELNIGEEVTLIIKAQIPKDYYIYTIGYNCDDGPQPISFSFNKKGYKLIDNISSNSEPKVKRYPYWDCDINIQEGSVEYKQKIQITENISKIECLISYQTCNLSGQCLPREYTGIWNIKVNGTKVKQDEISNNNIIEENTIEHDSIIIEENKEIIENLGESKETRILKGERLTEIVENKSMILFFIFAFGMGLLAILTPCVFPMIPMTVAFFMHGDEVEKQKSKRKAFVYGISIIAIYVIFGTIVAFLFGASFTNWLSTHWLPNMIFFIIFVVFAASFLGMFELTLPSWLSTSTDKQADKGGYTGAFFMALTLVIVSFSCTVPIVGSIIIMSAEGEIIKPIVGMLGFSLAFALPFTLFAIFPSWLKNLPKSGGWLNTVKVVLGFLELALALKFLSIADLTSSWGILDREIYLALWIIIFALLGLYLLGKLKLAHDSGLPYLSVPRLILAVLTFTFVVYLIPGLFGAPLKAISGYLPPMYTQDFNLYNISDKKCNNELCDTPTYGDILKSPDGFNTYFELEQAINCAKKQNKPLFIDFTGHGCPNCREMEANVWSDPYIYDKLNNDFVIVALYADDKTELKEEDWVKSVVDGKVNTTIGKINLDFQSANYKKTAQPYYAIIDPFTEDDISVPTSYDRDVNNYKKFIKDGLSEFKRRYNK